MIEAELQNLKSRFERDFFRLLKSTSLKSAPQKLREATEYALGGSTKRIRPIIAIEAARLARSSDHDALLIAAACECLHSYSLVHDDLPAMDDDDMRRGQLSCHRKYGEATAILVGDLLQALGFELVAKTALPMSAVDYFARCAGAQGMVSGQFLDMEDAHANVKRLHRLKTAKLIQATVVLPFFASEKKIPLAIFRWGQMLGMLFQMTDDLLDVTADSKTLGKTAGKDFRQKKKTFISTLGIEAALLEVRKTAEKLQTYPATIFPESDLFRALPDYLLNRTR